MRILHLIKNFDFGGSENHLCELANALDSLGNNVFIIGRKGRQLARLNKNISFIPLRFRSIFLFIDLLRVIYFIRHHRIEVIHAHQRQAISIGTIAGKITHTPVVVTVHGRSQYDLRSWHSRKYADKIIFVSQFVMEASKRFPDIRHKVVFIPNGIPICKDKPSKNNTQISYISRMDKKHSSVIQLIIQNVLPKLIIDYPTVTFHIIGGGHGLQEVKKEAERFNHKHQKTVCIVSGYQSGVLKHIQKSMLVMAVGRSALEALACGVPVLSVNKKRMGGMISAQNYPFLKVNNFVAVGENPPDENTLFRTLQNFLSNLSYWQNETEKLQEMVDMEFSSINLSTRIETIYKELIV